MVSPFNIDLGSGEETKSSTVHAFLFFSNLLSIQQMKPVSPTHAYATGRIKLLLIADASM